MPPQLKTITISALDDAIIRLTQAKTRLTMAQTSLTVAQTSLTKAKDTLLEFQQLLKCHEDEAENKKDEESDLLEEEALDALLKRTNMSFAEIKELVISSKMGASSQEASQTASSQAALPKGSPMADMDEVELIAEPGTTE